MIKGFYQFYVKSFNHSIFKFQNIPSEMDTACDGDAGQKIALITGITGQVTDKKLYG